MGVPVPIGIATYWFRCHEGGPDVKPIYRQQLRERTLFSAIAITRRAGSHVVVGIAAWTWVAPHLGPPPLDQRALALTTIGALLPDIDHPASWAGQPDDSSPPMAELSATVRFSATRLRLSRARLLLRGDVAARTLWARRG